MDNVKRHGAAGVTARPPNSGAVVRDTWPSRDQLGHVSWQDVVEAVLWCFWHFWHGDDLSCGEILLAVLLGRDEQVRLVYGLLAGAFYMGKLFRPGWGRLNAAARN